MDGLVRQGAGGGELGEVDGPVVEAVGAALPGDALDGGGDAIVAGVVGGERQVPAVEALVEVAQVGDGGGGGAHDAAPLVDEGRLVEAVELPGVGHELPEPGGARLRDRARIEAALDGDDPEEVLGEPRLAQGEGDVLPVEAGPAVPLEEGCAPGVGAGEEADVAHGAPGDRDVDVREREGGERGALGIVEILRDRAVEAPGRLVVHAVAHGERARLLVEARAAHGGRRGRGAR